MRSTRASPSPCPAPYRSLANGSMNVRTRAGSSTTPSLCTTRRPRPTVIPTDPAVPDPVLHQVHHHLVQQHLVALDNRLREVAGHLDTRGAGLRRQRRQRGPRHGGEIHRIHLDRPVVQRGQAQQRLDDVDAALVRLGQTFHQLRDVLMIRIGRRHLEHRLHHRVRRPQLVRRVRREPPVLLERPLQPVQHLVERVRQVGELVADPGQPDPVVQRPTGRRCAAAVISCSGFSIRPARYQPPTSPTIARKNTPTPTASPPGRGCPRATAEAGAGRGVGGGERVVRDDPEDQPDDAERTAPETTSRPA